MTTVVVPDPDGLTTGFQDRLDEENQIFAKVDAVTWGRDNHDLVAIFQDLLNGPDGINAGSSTGSNIRARFTKLVKMVRQMALAFPSLDDAAASPPPPAPLKALLTSLKSDADLQEHLRNLVGFEKKIGRAHV